MTKKYTLSFNSELMLDTFRTGNLSLSPWIPVNGSNNRPLVLNLVYPYKEPSLFQCFNRKQVTSISNLLKNFWNDPSRQYWTLSSGGDVEKKSPFFELTFTPTTGLMQAYEIGSGAPYDTAIYSCDILNYESQVDLILYPLNALNKNLGNSPFSEISFDNIAAGISKNLVSSLTVAGPKFGDVITGIRFTKLGDSIDSRMLAIKNSDGTVWQLPADTIGVFRYPGGFIDVNNITAVAFQGAGWQNGDQIEFWV